MTSTVAGVGAGFHPARALNRRYGVGRFAVRRLRARAVSCRTVQIEHVDSRPFARSLDLSAIAACALGVVLAAGVPAWHGGYFQENWAWLALITLLLSTVLLIVSTTVQCTLLQLVFLGGLVAFACWMTLSALWSHSVTSTLLETQRMLAYVGVVLLAILAVRRRNASALLGGVLIGVVLVAVYAFLTRLLPDRVGTFNSASSYRLSAPIGYWNGLGIYAVMGTLLALAFAARSRWIVARGLAGAAVVPLATTLYFTFSRGSWLALGVGVVAAVAVDPRRLQLIAVGIGLAPFAGAAVVLASRSHALTTAGSSLADATHAGHRLLPVLLLLALGAGLVTAAVAVVERRISVGRSTRVAFAVVLAVAVLGGIGASWNRYGSPWSLADSAWRQFNAGPSPTSANLRGRLFDLSSNGRIDLWRVAWHDFGSHPLAGTGAGTYVQSWLQRRPDSVSATNAHNLYVETLAEVGVLGFALLLVVLVTPVVAAVRVRRRPLAAPVFGAYAAWLVHAGVDWDWQLVGVTLVAALIAVALCASTPSGEMRVGTGRIRIAAAAAVVALTAAAFVGFMANVPLGKARTALESGDWQEATHQAKRAKTWAPWSSQTWQYLGEGQQALGNQPGARRSLSEALRDDPRSWRIWLDYALVTSAAEQRRALATAQRLDPLEPVIAETRGELLTKKKPAQK